ncbi:MAG: cation transporter [Eubacteriales bacterium]|nr:cation transporter [Eubacteriales bacterium]
MKKTFRLEGLDCANCAAKIEKKVKAMDGVKDATVSFFAQKLVLEADDGRFDEIARKVAEVVHHTDADCTMVL